ncbi:MAG TPA: GatB/YqeY domain-containing protein [Acidimicrobiia bacterium]|nr:GatB/YqeY domain-containing protein [Acidimicrobiia bacterium]
MPDQDIEQSEIRSLLGSDLTTAMRTGDKVRIRAIRSTMTAIANAEAVEAPTGAEGTVGYSDVPRRQVGRAQIHELIESEIGERETAAAQYRGVGRPADAEILEAEIGVLRVYLDRV